MVYEMAKAAGMPPCILRAYQAYIENMKVYNCLAGGMGTPYMRRCGITQGCPFSMMYVALIMRPWIIIMRCIPGVQAFILADDVLILVSGQRMIASVAEAIDKAHACLHSMGAKVAPDKSHNFASTVEGKKEGIQAKIQVAQDFRYLGAHLTAGRNCNSSTMEKMAKGA